jgi:hypothetical protein
MGQDELYYRNCGFNNIRLSDPLLRIAWATIHGIHEQNPDNKTTDEEIINLLACLEGCEVFSENLLQHARDKGMRRRFVRIDSWK